MENEQMDSVDKRTLLNMAIANLTIGDFFHAFYYIGKATEGEKLDQFTPNLLFLYGAACSYFRRDRDAIMAFNAFLESSDDEILSYEANLYLAFSYRNEGNHIQAANIFRQLAEKKHPFITENDVLFQNASTSLIIGNFSLAAKLDFVITHSNSDILNFELCYRYTGIQNFEMAIEFLKKISEDGHKSRDIMFLKAYINYKVNSLQIAYNLLKSILNDNDLDGFAWGLIGLVFAKNNNITDAIICLKNARILQPDVIEFSMNLSTAIDMIFPNGANDISSNTKIFCNESRLIPINWELSKLTCENSPSDVIIQGRSIFKSFHEVSIQKLLKSPAEMQEIKFRTSPPYLTKEFYYYINDCDNILISEKSKQISCFPSDDK